MDCKLCPLENRPATFSASTAVRLGRHLIDDHQKNLTESVEYLRDWGYLRPQVEEQVEESELIALVRAARKVTRSWPYQSLEELEQALKPFGWVKDE